jgi:hypothetical protein
MAALASSDCTTDWPVVADIRRMENGSRASTAPDFHSFGRTLITLLENLGVDQVRIARYVGHQLPTIGFTVYSGGSSETDRPRSAAGGALPTSSRDGRGTLPRRVGQWREVPRGKP